MYTFFKRFFFNKWVGFLLICITFSFIFLLTNRLVKELKIIEKNKIENLAISLELISKNSLIDNDVQDFLFKIIEDNSSIPVILVSEDGKINYYKNLPKHIAKDNNSLYSYFNKINSKNLAIEVNLPDGKNFIYYGNSILLETLKYFPIISFLFIIVFIGFSYWYFKTIKEKENSSLWAGMAKETAHQIGTPLSSLMGWTEILKLESIDQTPVIEIEKDVERLKNIAERFSKIGSEAILEKTNIVNTIDNTITYLKGRLSNGIEFTFSSNNQEILINHNITLISWIIENLVKNAADAMQNKGKISITIKELNKKIEIKVKDTGTGIPNAIQNKIFTPGFSTKKRGWGLGLSLAKRIIKQYHNGKIYLAKSSKDEGSTFIIILKK